MCEIEELRVALVRNGKELVPAATRWHDKIGDRSRVVKPAGFGMRGIAKLEDGQPFPSARHQLIPDEGQRSRMLQRYQAIAGSASGENLEAAAGKRVKQAVSGDDPIDLGLLGATSARVRRVNA